ncbi:hypothetical protein ACFLYL_05095 [Chloroflexota bacterium]
MEQWQAGERKEEIKRKTADQIGAKYDLLYQRQCLVKDIRAYIPRFQYNHPELAKTLAALWREVAVKAITDEALNIHRLTFNNFLNQKVFPVLEEEERRQSLEAKKHEQLSKIDSLIREVNRMDKRYKGFGITNIELENWLAELIDNRKKVEAGQALTMEDYLLHILTIPWGMQRLEATLTGIKQRKEEEERQRKANIAKLKLSLKEVGHYLRRKRFDEATKEDPILILQQLGVISPTGFNQGLVKGYWQANWTYGKLQYQPPIRDFVDMVGRSHSYSDIKSWVNWQAIYPLLWMAHEQLQAKIKGTKSKA